MSLCFRSSDSSDLDSDQDVPGIKQECNSASDLDQDVVRSKLEYGSDGSSDDRAAVVEKPSCVKRLAIRPY